MWGKTAFQNFKKLQASRNFKLVLLINNSALLCLSDKNRAWINITDTKVEACSLGFDFNYQSSDRNSETTA